MNHQWNRPITHQKYSKKYSHKDTWLDQYIYRTPVNFDIVILTSKFVLSVDQKYYSKHVYKTSVLIFAMVSFILSLTFTNSIIKGEQLSGSELFFYSFLLLVTFMCVLYYFTAKKELILNRLDGTITFPGWLWMKNVTMPFSEVIFIKGDYEKIRILRPYRFFSIPADLHLALGGHFEQISFITWYMDKNRPLPPGTALDPYREEDFERRKAEGFQSPLYGSCIPTPEASQEHEKEKIEFVTNNKDEWYRELNSRWYDPNVDKDWVLTNLEEIFKNAVDLDVVDITRCRYMFPDGCIVYVKREGDNLMVPPINLDYDAFYYND